MSISKTSYPSKKEYYKKWKLFIKEEIHQKNFSRLILVKKKRKMKKNEKRKKKRKGT